MHARDVRLTRFKSDTTIILFSQTRRSADSSNARSFCCLLTLTSECESAYDQCNQADGEREKECVCVLRKRKVASRAEECVCQSCPVIIKDLWRKLFSYLLCSVSLFSILKKHLLNGITSRRFNSFQYY